MASDKKRDYFETLFEFAPLPLWEEDIDGVLHLFASLRERGVEDLETLLEKEPSLQQDCLGATRLLHVNRRALAMLKAGSPKELASRLGEVFPDGLDHPFQSKLLALWKGEQEWKFTGACTTLTGEKLDVLMHWCRLPEGDGGGARGLMTIEDVTLRMRAEHRLQDLFEAAPISLWEEDWQGLKEYFDNLRSQGVTDLKAYLDQHPKDVTACMRMLKVLDVNQKTLELFGAASKEELLSNLTRVFRDEMRPHFTRELIDLWNGKTAYDRDGINYALNGEPLNIHLDFRLMPGHEKDFSWVLIALQDITARKKAEDYLRYLGIHDVLTGLYNRLFFEETLQRLEQERQDPVSVLLADMDGLKHINDSLGHQAGDNFIRRAADVIKAAFPEPNVAARIGGDEFGIFLPGAGEPEAAAALENLRALVALNNKYYHGLELSMSMGAATSSPGQPLEKVISLADDAMYRAKGEHYRRRKGDR